MNFVGQRVEKRNPFRLFKVEKRNPFRLFKNNNSLLNQQLTPKN